jgi:hypothetical protein
MFKCYEEVVFGEKVDNHQNAIVSVRMWQSFDEVKGDDCQADDGVASG